jgi:hypothetical protein
LANIRDVATESSLSIGVSLLTICNELKVQKKITDRQMRAEESNKANVNGKKHQSLKQASTQSDMV